MMRSYFIFLLGGLIACNQPKHSVPDHSFFARVLPSPFDTSVFAIADYNDYILCAQVNGKIAILDSAYSRQPALEEVVNRQKITDLVKRRDTVFFISGDMVHYIADSFSVKPYKKSNIVPYAVLFEDSAYVVTECCAGEFGGSIFFLHKASHKTYSYPATCAAQVMATDTGYFVCSNLAHLSGITDYYFISDPKNLYELNAKQERHCNWWTEVDSLVYYWQKDQSKFVKCYSDNRYSMTLLNFYRDDSLYAIVSGDSSTYLTILRDSAFVIKDKILDKKIHFHQNQVVRSGGRYISLLRLTGGSPFAAYRVNGDASGLVVVNGQNIDMIFGTKNNR